MNFKLFTVSTLQPLAIHNFVRPPSFEVMNFKLLTVSTLQPLAIHNFVRLRVFAMEIHGPCIQN